MAMEMASNYFFSSPSCYRQIVEEHQFGDTECLKFMYSRLLSLTVLIGAVIVKLPQILKIVGAGSAEGLSYAAIIFEMMALTFTCTYNYAKNFPFSSWGESFFIAVQVVILMFFMFRYNKDMSYFAVFMTAYVFILWYLTSPYVSLTFLSFLQASVIPLMLSSRLTQIYTTYSQQSTGQLSFITSFLNMAGTASRIFTTIQETQDPIILVMFVSNFIMNGIIVLQFVYYRNSGPEKSEKKED